VPYISGTVYAHLYIKMINSKMKGISSQLQHIIIKPCKAKQASKVILLNGKFEAVSEWLLECTCIFFTGNLTRIYCQKDSPGNKNGISGSH
jgi:hypothetical protein